MTTTGAWKRQADRDVAAMVVNAMAAPNRNHPHAPDIYRGREHVLLWVLRDALAGLVGEDLLVELEQMRATRRWAR